jgi:ribosomal protein S18 acetylase RimI-like enzyme
MLIRTATLLDIPAIVAIAYNTWPNTYSAIISQEQIAFMLDAFYNSELIEEQMKNDHHFFLVANNDDNDIVGYAHIYLQESGLYKLSKLYVLPNQQGKQIGKLLLDGAEKHVVTMQKNALELNVNRHNKAKDFYLKNGYCIIETIDIPLDKYWLNDFIMRKELDHCI